MKIKYMQLPIVFSLLVRERKRQVGSNIVKFFAMFMVGMLIFSLPACATGPKTAFHSFGFGDYGENEGIEILNYQYGSARRTGTHADEGFLATGHIGQTWHVSGVLPVGDLLYVKWRIKSTGKIYEDTVDLKDRLPSDMDHMNVHFVVDGEQLYVYLISRQSHAPNAPDCAVSTYRSSKCKTLYPITTTNF